MAAPSAEDFVSVVMPVHNALPHLDGAVRSILDQTHDAFEFVIYDDGSTDGSTERLRQWRQQDSRIRLFEGKRNLGPVGSSSFVVAHSSAPFVARMDADDLCAPDRLAREFQALRSNPNAGLVGTLFDVIDEHGRPIRGPDYWRLSRHSAFPPFAAHGSIMFRRPVFEQVGGYRPQCEYWEDQCYSRPFCDILEPHAEIIRYEQGSAGNRYITASAPVQNPRTQAALIEAHAFDAKAGEGFFRARLDKHASSEVALFTANQQPGALPAAMGGRGVVAFFTSSSDEMFAVTDDTRYGTFVSQHEIALALAQICAAQGLQLVVRLHPHLRFKHPAWRREWDFAELERCGALVVQADDPADSYAVIDASRCVVTSGSTVALEATYLGRPNVVVGDWVGRSIGASAGADTPDELAAFIADPKLPQHAFTNALRFGSFQTTGGTALPEFDVANHPNLVRIDGRVVDRVRHPVQKIRFLLHPKKADPGSVDLKSGLQAGRVVLAPGTDYSTVVGTLQGSAAMSGATKARRASTENSRSGE